MSDKPSRPDIAASRKFTPDLTSLERRALLSQTVSFPDGSSVVIPAFLRLPRTGGVSMQSGTLVEIGVGQSNGNAVEVDDKGKGAVIAEWNGEPVHSFTGASSIAIQARRAANDQITFHLAGPQASVSTQAASTRRTSGTAVQTGTVLTVTVDKPISNTVLISNEGGGAVQVEWNRGTVHSFSGVETIVVDTHKGTSELVALHDVNG
jgi:hypothetical protein